MPAAVSSTPGQLLRPPDGVDFSRVLQGPGQSPLRLLAGAALGMLGYALLFPVLAQAVMALGWVLDGRPGTFALYYREAVAFLHPCGLVGANLGLALLIWVVMALMRHVAHREARWATSVQPGMRWRYLAICFVVAAVVLNAILLLGGLGVDQGLHAQPRIWVWLVAVLLTSPLQAAGEEYLFRGWLLQSFGAMVGERREGWLRWGGVVLSALVFALCHGVQNAALFVDRFGFGLLAGALVVLTGGLEAGIACHVANNLFAFGWAAFTGGIAQARALQAIGWANAFSDLLGFALFGVIAWWISRRMRLATTTPPRQLPDS